MKFTLREYKAIKTKSYLKKNNLFFFFNGVNQNSNNWIKIEQELANRSLNYYKVFNKTSTKICKRSIYKNMKPLISSITFFVKPTLNNILISRQALLNLETFVFLAVKMNDKIYSFNQLEYINSLKYCTTKLFFYQFSITNIKSCVRK